jgi:teichuronic acid biosynthesis glycosyltransferase TuaC
MNRNRNVLKKVLYISPGYPRKSDPANNPTIGYSLAYTQKQGVNVNVLSIKKVVLKGRTSIIQILKYLLVLFSPLILFDRHKFLDQEYKIYKIYYSFLSSFWLPIFLIVFVKIKSYDLLHYHFLWSTKELILLKKIFKISSIITIHGSDLHKTAVKDTAARMEFKKAIGAADKVIYVSKGLRDIADSIGLTTNKDVIIPNGYDPQNFFLTKKVTEAPVFGFVGHLYKIKRADKIPEIFKYIKEEIKEAELLIVGGGETSQNLRDYMEEKLSEYGLIDSVVFVGEVHPSKVSKYYAEMDILLFPSRNEGFGAVAIEARACGVPVVGSDKGGIPEAIGEGGVTVKQGRDFERRFAKEVVRLYRDLPSRKVIYSGAKSNTWENVVERILEIYEIEYNLYRKTIT